MKNITNGYKTPHKNMIMKLWEMKLEKFCGLCLKWNHSTDHYWITAQSQTTKLDENDDEQPMELILLYEVDIDI